MRLNLNFMVKRPCSHHQESDKTFIDQLMRATCLLSTTKICLEYLRNGQPSAGIQPLNNKKERTPSSILFMRAINHSSAEISAVIFQKKVMYLSLRRHLNGHLQTGRSNSKPMDILGRKPSTNSMAIKHQRVLNLSTDSIKSHP